MQKEETIKIVKPLVTYMERAKGWHVENIHGSQFQEGLPDLYAMHPKYSPKWIECKVIRKGNISFTPAQKRKFPIFVANNVPTWVIAGYDLRDSLELHRAYQSLFKEPNLGYFLNPITRKLWLQ